MSSPYTVSPYLRVTALEPTQDRRDLTWRDNALCRQVDPDMFYPEKEEDMLTAGAAKDVCRSCPVRLPCLGDALSRPGELGVWGGFAERVRVTLGRQHAAGKSLGDIIAEDDARYYARLETQVSPAERYQRQLAAQRAARQRKREAAEVPPNTQSREAA